MYRPAERYPKAHIQTRFKTRRGDRVSPNGDIGQVKEEKMKAKRKTKKSRKTAQKIKYQTKNSRKSKHE